MYDDEDQEYTERGMYENYHQITQPKSYDEDFHGGLGRQPSNRSYMSKQNSIAQSLASSNKDFGHHNAPHRPSRQRSDIGVTRGGHGRDRASTKNTMTTRTTATSNAKTENTTQGNTEVFRRLFLKRRAT
eukprot:UN00561